MYCDVTVFTQTHAAKEKKKHIDCNWLKIFNHLLPLLFVFSKYSSLCQNRNNSVEMRQERIFDRAENETRAKTLGEGRALQKESSRSSVFPALVPISAQSKSEKRTEPHRNA